MPLIQEPTKDAFDANVKELIDSGRDPKVATAIAYRVLAEAKKKRRKAKP